MKIIIPSRGRPDGVRTLEKLVHDDITIVVPKDELRAYARHAEKYPDVAIVGVECSNIMEKRQWILDQWGAKHKIVMMDDDLRFRVRAKNGKFGAADARDLTRMLSQIKVTLDSYLHGGIADEFMCQHNPPGHVTRKRYNQVLAYNLTSFKKNRAPRYRLTINEEHDMHLQLARMGHTSFVLTDFTKGDRYNASGGCSTWRTPALEMEQFEKFEDLWPGVVKVVDSKTSISGHGVRVAWRKMT